ncbi:hypothetical protein [Frankia sp. EAN1pec]|uniref:hypothetical protein n=1 Tax=Parafrankia sp. (strain EAN1pec) TaxID=298653 RepID=UPI00005411D0
MRRRWSAHILIGTAIVLAVGTSGTALAMAAQPADPTESGTEGGAPALPPDDAFTRCLVANGAQVHTDPPVDGRRSVRVTLDPAHQSPALDTCQRFAPAPGTIGGGPAPIQPLSAEQNATVTECLRAEGVTFPAPGTTQVLGLPPADEPIPPGSAPAAPAPGAGSGSGSGSGTGAAPAPGSGGAPVLVPGPVVSGGPGGYGGLVISSEAGAGGEAAPGGPDVLGDAPDVPGLPGDAPGGPGASGDAPDAKVLGALGRCAQAAGLPGLALETHSADRTTTVVAMAVEPRS